MSSWPTWTPSASTASARSGRSLRMKRAPCVAHRAFASFAAATISASPAVLSRSCTRSAPPRSAPSSARSSPARSATKYRCARCSRARRSAPVPLTTDSVATDRRYHRCFGTGARNGLRGRHRGRRPSRADPGHAGEARSRAIGHNPGAFDVAIVGAGLIGLSAAWRAAARGLRVCVLDRGELGRGTSHVSAGMLAPISEADAGEQALLRLGLDSARAWPAFAAELEAASGIGVDYRAHGTLLVARDRDEAEALARELALRERFGLRAERLLPSRARRLEPALAPTVRLALDVPDDHAVDPRLVVAALALAAERAGAVLRPRAEVAAVRLGAGVTLRDGERVAADRVVVAAGPWSGAIAGIPDDARVPVRPVKGQTLRLRDPSGPGLLERVVRWDGGYLVPRGDGRYVLGATQEERGFDTAMTVGGVHDLLRDCSELVPGVLELEVEELIAGLRPGTPDNAPIVGASPAAPELVWATGHYRNGALLTPVTADLVVAALTGEDEPDPAFSPARFAGVVA